MVVATADDGVTLDQAPVELGDGAPQVVVLELAAEVTRRAAAAAAIEREDRLDAEAAARDPFPEQGDGTFLDRQTGFLWTVASSARQGLWNDADAHCEDLQLGDLDNWQLPRRLELDSVLQRLDPVRYPWGPRLWSSTRQPRGNRLWVTNSSLLWRSAVRDPSNRRLTHWAVCVARTGAR